MIAQRLNLSRVRNKYRQILGDYIWRRPFVMRADVPHISFTFDDFPRSAYLTGGRLLEKYGAQGTFYVSIGLLGTETVCGRIALTEDLRALLQEGHELGCHTFDHLDGWISSTKAFEKSVIENSRAFKEIVPSGNLEVFAYPIGTPRLKTKRVIGNKFLCCRGGGQAFNSGVIDLNLLKAYFLDWRTRSRLDMVKCLIDQNNTARGWLIFVTHDVGPDPSRYGCKAELFEEIVRYAASSGANIGPISRVARTLGVVSG